MMPFEYFISEKNGFVVASLIGTIEAGNLDRLEELTSDILQFEFSKLVLNFRDVSSVSDESIPGLARLQKAIREKEADLRLCGLRPEVKERLAHAGILRPSELADNLQSALQSMASRSRKAS